MAREIKDIKQQITSTFLSFEAIQQVYGVTPNKSFDDQFSKLSLESLFFYCVAFGIWTLETLFDIFKKDIDNTIATLKPHTLYWYALKAKAFQYGDNLPIDTDIYPAIEDAKKIVKHAAVIEQDKGLRIKIAKDMGDDLGPLSALEMTAFAAYMARIKDAGVKLYITTQVADLLLLHLRIKYNPLVLNNNGSRIDGTASSPVEKAIKNYLENLPFNGIFSINKLTDAIQAVDGVDDLRIDAVATRYGNLDYKSVDIETIPDSGYLRVDADNLTINYVIL